MIARDEIKEMDIAKEISELWKLTEEQQKLLSEYITIRHYKKNEIIYKDQDYPDNVFCLISGKVKIYKDGIGGRNQIIRVIKPIEFFGYRAYFANEEYKTVGMAFESSTVARIPIDIVVQMMKENYHISFFFIRHLSIELGASDDRTVNLTQKHIRGRLAEALLFLKDCYGVEEDGYTLSIYLSREDLASLSNMTTSNAIRTLSSFATEKLIAIDGRKIKIIEDEELRKVSKIG
jgi:CRP-like cAMP-binding protein